MNHKNYTCFPDVEHRFFLCDPSNNEFMYFKTEADRDAMSEDLIHSHLDDCWSEEVDQIIAGEITHHTIMCDVNIAPKREDFESDEEFDDAQSTFGNSDADYTCNYKLAPLEDKGEKPPK